jgi:hypothetical protein
LWITGTACFSSLDRFPRILPAGLEFLNRSAMGAPEWLTKKDGEEVAARPHPLSIVTGLVGPLVAIVAMALSYASYRVSNESLRTSQASLEIGQRAYLSVSDTTAMFSVDSGTDHPWIHTRYRFTVQNLGNTPAHIQLIQFQTLIPQSDLDTESRRLRKTDRGLMIVSGSLGESGELGHGMSITFNDSSDDPFSGENGRFLGAQDYWQLRWVMLFTDVFDKERDATWCARYWPKNNRFEGCPCTETEFWQWPKFTLKHLQ